MDVLVAGDAPIGGLDAVLDGPDQLLAGDLLLGVELEEGTDEVSTHDGLRSLCRSVSRPPLKKKRGGHPRRGAAVQLDWKYTPGSVDAQTWRPSPHARAVVSAGATWRPMRRSAAGARREPPRHVVLEDLDELRHEAVAAQRPVEPAVDEDRRDRLLERARQQIPMSACFDSPGPLTTQPMTATRRSSAPGCVSRHSGIRSLQVALDLLGHLLEEREVVRPQPGQAD